MEKFFSNTRREFVQNLVGLIPAAAVGGGLAAGLPFAADAEPAHGAVYFTEAEMAFVTAACGILIPAEEPGPGAVEAGVPTFIDRQMAADYGQGRLMYRQGPFDTTAAPEMGYQFPGAPAAFYRQAIAGINVYANQQYQHDFSILDEAAQLEILKGLEEGKIAIAGVPAKAFFDMLLDNVKQGYFSDPKYGGNRGMEGWKMLGYPGARADFADWAEQYNKKYPLGPVDIAGETA
jgi:gluconate 2-dehydrogenase gamma chain